MGILEKLNNQAATTQEQGKTSALVCKGGVCVKRESGKTYTDPAILACKGKKEGEACTVNVEPAKVIACIDGSCVETDEAKVTKAQIDACAGKSAGESCTARKGVKCEGGYIYEGKFIKGVSKCRENYFEKLIDGEWWCCPAGEEEDGECIDKYSPGFFIDPEGHKKPKPCKTGFTPKVINNENVCCKLSTEPGEDQCLEGYDPGVDEGGNPKPCKTSPKGTWGHKTIGGKVMCCKEEGGGEEGEGCQGGYKKDPNEFTPEQGRKGKFWKDDQGVIPDNTIHRDPRMEGHVVWFMDPAGKEWGWQNMVDLWNHYEKGTPLVENFTEGPCRKGYVTKDVNGEKWCCPEEGGGGGGAGGTWGWSGGLQGLFAKMMERIKFLMDYPTGLTPEEKQGIINFGMQGIQRSERGKTQSMTDQLSRMGMLGSGLEITEGDKIRRGTREMQANFQQQMAMDDINRRFQELMGTTGMSADLTKLLMGGETTEEQMNASRRAESNEALGYLMSLMGGFGGMTGMGSFAPYYQAIMNQYGTGANQSASMANWLPMLGYLLGGQLGGGSRYMVS